MDDDAPQTPAEAEIRADLLDRHGPLLSGEALCKALGYPSIGALRQSITRKTVPVPTFLIDGRRGRFALTWVVARWLASRQLASSASPAPSAYSHPSATGPPAHKRRVVRKTPSRHR